MSPWVYGGNILEQCQDHDLLSAEMTPIALGMRRAVNITCGWCGVPDNCGERESCLGYGCSQVSVWAERTRVDNVYKGLTVRSSISEMKHGVCRQRAAIKDVKRAGIRPCGQRLRHERHRYRARKTRFLHELQFHQIVITLAAVCIRKYREGGGQATVSE